MKEGTKLNSGGVLVTSRATVFVVVNWLSDTDTEKVNFPHSVGAWGSISIILGEIKVIKGLLMVAL